MYAWFFIHCSCHPCDNDSNHVIIKSNVHFNSLVQDCRNSSANALELLQSCTKPLTYMCTGRRHTSRPWRLDGISRDGEWRKSWTAAPLYKAGIQTTCAPEILNMILKIHVLTSQNQSIILCIMGVIKVITLTITFNVHHSNLLPLSPTNQLPWPWSQVTTIKLNHW